MLGECAALYVVEGSVKCTLEALYKVIYSKSRYSAIALICSVVSSTFGAPPPTL